MQGAFSLGIDEFILIFLVKTCAPVGASHYASPQVGPMTRIISDGISDATGLSGAHMVGFLAPPAPCGAPELMGR